MEDHAQAGGVQRDAAEKIAGAGERKEGVDQPDEVASQREAQPEQCHKTGKYQSPLSLMQVRSAAVPIGNPQPIPSTHYILHIDCKAGTATVTTHRDLDQDESSQSVEWLKF